MTAEPITSTEITKLIIRLEDPHVKRGSGDDGLRIIVVDDEDTKFALFWAPKVETIDQILEANPHLRQLASVATVEKYGSIGVVGRPIRDDIVHATLAVFAVFFPDIPELEPIGRTVDDVTKAQIKKAKARTEETAVKILDENIKRGMGPRGWGG